MELKTEEYSTEEEQGSEELEDLTEELEEDLTEIELELEVKSNGIAEALASLMTM
jgi:hypothetical protein